MVAKTPKPESSQQRNSKWGLSVRVLSLVTGPADTQEYLSVKPQGLACARARAHTRKQGGWA